ncbi:MAG: ABC transporter ATP-binding protein [Anaerolineae bacterium]|nr:ABC transporter ATP-binding protein/permease [Thermoflexales bacterium]MDW8407946.1 ABC transporter ATP-binding protein [Anaerolineae bacterium]
MIVMIAQPTAHSVWRNLWRCYGYLRPYWKATCVAYAATLALNVLSIVSPQWIRAAIDDGIGRRDLPSLSWSVAALLMLTLLKGGFTFLQGRWSEVASQNVAYDLRADIQRKLTILSFSFHDQSEAGDLLSRAVQDVDRIRFLTGRATLRIVESLALLIGTAAILFWMNPQLALLAIAGAPVLIHRSLSFGRRIRPLSLAIQRQLGVLTTRLEQNLRGARIVKAFAQEQAEIERFERENEHWFELSARSARLTAVNGPLLNLIANIGVVFILWYGGRLVLERQLSIGELVAFMTYMAQLVGPVRVLGQIIPAIAQAGAAAERVFEIADAAPDVRDAPDAMPLPPIKGHVRFEQVSFAYGRHSVLRDITFEARPGQIIALLGRTGSGKSTVVNLLPRFFDPTAGRITIDGYDIRTVTLASLRAHIGIVLQETTLFAATIRENIAFGRPDAADEEVIAAAKAAQAHDFIMQTPDGYHTQVGERGVTLSGGQKQRIAIARALLTDPRILILDDATSSVDAETEQLIQRALDRLMVGRTTFVIAHRLSTVRKADLILVLDRGQIVARGTHEELLRTSGLYADIYHRQLKPRDYPSS